jgi:ABC-type glycerol-3-phosphate transport system substrate-binding protein
VAIAATALLGTTACSGNGSGSTGSGGGDTTLTIQISAEWGPMMDVLVTKFEEEHEGVTVELETITPEQKSTTNSQVISSANPPDLAQASGDWRALAKNGDLEPLDDVFADIEERLAPGTAEQLKVDDVFYGVPTGQAYDNIIFYNTDLFEEAGITVPDDRRIASSEDLYEMVEKLDAIGVEGVAIGGTGGYQFGWMVDGLLPTSASEEELTSYLTSWDPAAEFDVAYTEPAFVNAVETIKEWGDNGVFQDGYLGADTATASGLYYQGAAGMILGGSWYIGQFAENNLDFETDFLLLPPVEGGKEAKLSLLTGTSMVVPSKAPNVELAKEFVELWMSDEMQVEAIANTNFSFPNVTTVDQSALDIDPLGAALIEEGAANGTYPTWSSIVPGAAGQQVIDPNVAAMLAGTITAEEVAAKQQEAIEAAREAE